MKRALVTGGLGFIGSNLVHALERRGVRVTVLDNLDAQCGGNRRNLEGMPTEFLDLHEADLRDADAVRRAVTGQDWIFHCAARTSHAGSMTAPFEDVAVNCVGTLTLLEAMREHAPEAKLVHVGTSTQIGRSSAGVIAEDHVEFPVDIYSANKTASEKYVLVYASAYGLRTTVVRLANNFGPRANIRSPAFGFANFFVGLALQGKEITVFGDGAQLRTMTYVADSVEALCVAAENDASCSQVWFAVADEQVSVRDLAVAISSEIGGSVRFVPWPAERKAIEVGDSVISNAKLKAGLGWQPRTSLREGLRATRSYFIEHLASYL